MFENINIKDVVDVLGFDYDNCGDGEYKIKGTDGWRFNINKNLMKDFSNDRGEGNPFTFVMDYKGLTKEETINWFKETFNLGSARQVKQVKEIKELSKEKRLELKAIWDSLAILSDDDNIYLASRGVDPNKVKDVVKSDNGIACLLYDTKGPCGCRIRTLSGDNRFSSIKGFKGDGVYLNGINKAKDYIYVVEGMFDFLTIRQFDTNVVGLGNVDQGLNVIKELAKKYKIRFIPDVDEAGKLVINKIKRICSFELLDISELSETSKDINELYLELDKPDSFIEGLDGNFKRVEMEDPFDNEKYDITFDHNTKNPYTWGLPVIDNKFGKPVERELCVFLGYPGMGKTEFTFFMANENVKLGNKVVYISLELTKDSLYKRLARKKAGVSKIEFQNKQYSQLQKNRMDQELIRLQKTEGLKLIGLEDKTIGGIEEVVKYYTGQGYNMFIIDNLGKIDRNGEDELTAFDDITSKLQDLKNDIGCPIILLHHLKKAGKEGFSKPGGASGFRGSQKIQDNCSFMMELWRDRDPDALGIDASRVELLGYKDTEDGITGEQCIYFYKGEYYEDYKY